MSEIEDMTNIIRIGTEGSYYLMKGSVQMILFLMQQYEKMKRAKILSAGEVQDFQKFIKATEGKIQMLNIPTEDARELEQIKQDFNAMKIHYTFLPDLNVGDGMVTIAFDQTHTPQVENWYQRFICSHLGGGEMSYEQLARLTEGQIAIVNLPFAADRLQEKDTEQLPEKIEKPEQISEGAERSAEIIENEQKFGETVQKKESSADGLEEAEKRTKKWMEKREEQITKLTEDFDKLHINYSVLPDLNVGDGTIQIAYAAADVPKLKAWYEAYRESLLPSLELPKELPEISLEEYFHSGKTDAKKYYNKQPEEIKTVLEKATKTEGLETDFFLSAAKKGAADLTEAVEPKHYQHTRKAPGASLISIHEKDFLKKGEDGIYIACLPGSGGQEFLPIPKTELYLQETEHGKVYDAVLWAEKAYPVVDAKGNLVKNIYGEDLADLWGSARKTFTESKKILPEKKTEKIISGTKKNIKKIR